MSQSTAANESISPSSEVALYYLAVSKRLDEVIPHVYWFKNSQLCQLLNISEPTRKRDAALLRDLGLIKCKHRRGCSRDEAVVFWEFRQLQRWSDRDEATNLIFNVLEAIHAEQRQGTSRAS
jgi:hypothetical protein